MQVVSAACAAVGSLASANAGCQNELHARGATAALVALLAEHAGTLSADGATAEGAGPNTDAREAAKTDDIAERAVWATVELVAANADLQDAVRAAQQQCFFDCPVRWLGSVRPAQHSQSFHDHGLSASITRRDSRHWPRVA